MLKQNPARGEIEKLMLAVERKLADARQRKPAARARSAESLALGTAAWLARTVLDNEFLARRIGGPNFPVQKASGSTTNSAGGFLVPTEVESAIMAFRDFSVFRENASVYTMGSDTLTVPRRTGSLGVSFVSENTTIPESLLTWDGVGFTAKKLAAFARFSNELKEDAAADVAVFFLQDAGAALGLKEDDCGFNGDGSQACLGMRGICPTLLDGGHAAGKVTAASGHGTFAQIDATDLSTLMAALPDKYWPNAKLYCSGFAGATTLMRLGATTGGSRMTGGGMRPQLSYGGVPVILTPKLPGTGSQVGSVMMLFGDLSSAAAVGSRGGLTLATSEDRYLEFDQTAFRVTERFDTVCHNLGDNSNAGAVVGLVGSA